MKRSVDRPQLDYYNREHVYVFICQITQDTPLTFNDGEVAEVQRFTLDQAENIMNGRDETHPSCEHGKEFDFIKKYLQENNLA